MILSYQEENMAARTTTKKVKYIGTQKFINAATGELEEMQVTNIEERDFNFTKVWIANIIQTLDLIGGQKIKVCTYIIDHVNRDNVFIGSQRDIAEKANVSYQTVNITVKALLDANFIRRQGIGVYILNPDMLYKGSRTGRLNVVQQYQAADYVPLSNKEKLNNLMDTINHLTEQANKLMLEIQKEENKNDDTRSEVDSRVQADAAR